MVASFKDTRGGRDQRRKIKFRANDVDQRHEGVVDLQMGPFYAGRCQAYGCRTSENILALSLENDLWACSDLLTYLCCNTKS